ncbi:MAG: MarC family protein [Planctomycetaceae bacterium]|nr:MarC family protein [Planctomycetaceae bacterium]
MQEWIAYIKAFIALFVVIDPIGNIPVFLSVTATLDAEQRKKAFTISIIAAFIILFVFTVLGQFILDYVFQIEIADIRIAGGILLFLMAVQNLLTTNEAAQQPVTLRVSAAQLGCVPLACPLLAGPGAMVTSLTIWQNPNAGPPAAILAIVLVLGIFWLLMLFVQSSTRLLGPLVVTAVSKVMMIFLAAIGVNMTLQGIRFYFPGP